MRRWPCWIGFAVLSISGVSFADAAETTRPSSSSVTPRQETPVHVTLRDGRSWLARVDYRTDDELLWLRFTRGAASLSTGFSWDLVESVRVGELRHSAAEFREQAAGYASRLPPTFSPATTSLPTLSVPPLGGVTTWSPSPGEIPGAMPGAIPGVPQGISPWGVSSAAQSLAIEARVANWDRDAEMDGIEVRVLPRSAWGQVVPVEGVVTIELVGRNRVSTEARPASLLERGTQGVRPADFVGGWGAVYRIPFRQIQPERQVELQPWGLVRVTLQGRGIPNLEAEAPVRLRTFNPVRDEMLEHSRHHDTFGRYKSRHW